MRGGGWGGGCQLTCSHDNTLTEGWSLLIPVTLYLWLIAGFYFSQSWPRVARNKWGLSVMLLNGAMSSSY